ncbi:MAG TPA: acyl carrier protein [Trebonia sp.]|jgi:act minimal PKS acyl carrier protein|nr:acyl carrier protein [Trebonia sp.]
MPHKTIELTDLCRVLRESAGVGAGIDLDGEILDVTFEDLGYDSIAMLETGARLSREYGVAIEDDAFSEATTPRKLLDLIGAA